MSGHNHSFEDVEAYVAKFDSPERDEWQKPEEVLDFINLKNSDILADIGAGTGYFSVRAAKRLNPGKVLAVDSEPNMLEYLRKRAFNLGIKNIETVLSVHHQVNLPQMANVILLVGTFHHIEERNTYFAELRKSLAPEGKLIIIENKAGTPIEPPAEMVVTPEQVVEELKSAGFNLIAESTTLPYQSMQKFESC